uniref:Uncharacterized protein n=1 Tax=Neisseria meningitidis alpha275 TaxID=295996 RepID=C6SH97_NEIME|nr:hypothetical protein NMW_0315 [Neisseria meningitidis alpha275]
MIFRFCGKDGVSDCGHYQYFLFGNVFYNGLNLNQYGVASPCRTICTVCGFVALS